MKLRITVLISFFYICIIISCKGQVNNNNDNNNSFINANPNQYPFTYPTLNPALASLLIDSVRFFYKNILQNHGYNGDFLVAKDGKILFQQYSGWYDLKSREHITDTTPIHLASISKTFTSTAILKLYQEHKLSLNDTLQKYFSVFPYKNITILMLLSHRSGLPNYVPLMDKLWFTPTHRYATNQDVLNFLTVLHPPMMFLPNKRFVYCNTNYVLLALIVEHITHVSFSSYIENEIFKPLGMTHSFVFNVQDAINYVPSYSVNFRPYPIGKLDCVYGDKNVYSTALDLLKWDNAIYHHSILNPIVQKLAFMAFSQVTTRDHYRSYGLGWRILYLKNKDKFDTIIYHNGWWHGDNTLFLRLISDKATIIALSNKEDHLAYKAKRLAYLFINHRNNSTDTTEVDEKTNEDEQ